MLLPVAAGSLLAVCGGPCRLYACCCRSKFHFVKREPAHVYTLQRACVDFGFVLGQLCGSVGLNRKMDVCVCVSVCVCVCVRMCVYVCICISVPLLSGYGCASTMCVRSGFWPTSALGHGARNAAPWSVVPLRPEAAVRLEDSRASPEVVGAETWRMSKILCHNVAARCHDRVGIEYCFGSIAAPCHGYRTCQNTHTEVYSKVIPLI